jgi:hypothetical protein
MHRIECKIFNDMGHLNYKIIEGKLWSTSRTVQKNLYKSNIYKFI